MHLNLQEILITLGLCLQVYLSFAETDPKYEEGQRDFDPEKDLPIKSPFGSKVSIDFKKC